MFSCQYCEIFKKIFFTEHLRWMKVSIPSLAPHNITFMNFDKVVCSVRKQQPTTVDRIAFLEKSSLSLMILLRYLWQWVVCCWHKIKAKEILSIVQMIYYVNFLLPVYEKVALSDFDITLIMNVNIAIQLTFTCSKSTKETLMKGVKYVQS